MYRNETVIEIINAEMVYFSHGENVSNLDTSETIFAIP